MRISTGHVRRATAADVGADHIAQIVIVVAIGLQIDGRGDALVRRSRFRDGFQVVFRRTTA